MYVKMKGEAMADKLNKIKENVGEFADDHSFELFYVGSCLVGLALAIPVMRVTCKWQGRAIGKEVAKVLKG